MFETLFLIGYANGHSEESGEKEGKSIGGELGNNRDLQMRGGDNSSTSKSSFGDRLVGRADEDGVFEAA